MPELWINPFDTETKRLQEAGWDMMVDDVQNGTVGEVQQKGVNKSMAV